MIRKFLFSFCCGMTIVCSLAQAQPIPVRSGSHDAFVRIVLDVPTGTVWGFENGKRSAQIILGNHSDGFDVTRVFSRIDRQIVGDVESTSNVLRIRLNCDCETTAFRQGDRMIVLDVARPEHTDGVLEWPPENNLSQTMSSLRIAGDAPLRFGKPSAQAAATPLGSSEADNSIRIQTPEMESTKKETVNAIPNAKADPVEIKTLEQAQKILTRGVGAAATRGILRPNGVRVDLPFTNPSPQIDVRVFNSSENVESRPRRETKPVAGHLKITSSADVPYSKAGSGKDSTLNGIECLDPQRATVSAWGTEFPMTARIAALRRILYSEFDKLQRDAVVDLARTYLHHGFGSEARQILSLDTEIASEYPEILEIADIMEFGHVRGTDFLQNFMDCDSEVALWAILAAPSVPASVAINTDAALRALTSLPRHLRSFIAPELSSRLLEYGDANGASAALRSLERAPEPLNAAAQLAQANLKIRESEVEEAQSLLADVVASNEQQSAEALIAYVNSHLAAETEIEENIAILIEAYATEMRDHPIGAELRRSHILALAQSGKFDEAFEALDRTHAPEGDEKTKSLSASLFALLAKNADDMVFLDHTFSLLGKKPPWSDPKINLAVAERLLSLGFPQQAEDLVEASPELLGTQSGRLLEARIALARNRPLQAADFSVGIDSEDARRLRAEANLQLGRYDLAQEIFLSLGDRENSEQALWLSDDWTDLVDAQTATYAAAARLASTPLSDDQAREGMLARSSSTIAESAQARSVIRSHLLTTVDGTKALE